MRQLEACENAAQLGWRPFLVSATPTLSKEARERLIAEWHSMDHRPRVMILDQPTIEIYGGWIDECQDGAGI